MGSYTSCIMDTADNDIEQDIISYANSLRDFKDEASFANWCWRKWSPESKWWGVDAMQKISLNFPKRIFRLRVRGDYNFCSYYLNGIQLEESEVFDTPRFPSVSLFKKKAKQKIIRDKARAEAAGKDKADKAKQLAAAELEKLKLRQKDLEQIIHSA